MEKPKKSDPTRETEEEVVDLGSGEITLNYYNTDLFTYSEPYNYMRHAYYQPDREQAGTAIFNMGLVDRLIEKDFPEHSQAWPDEQDSSAYIRAEMQQVDDDYEDLIDDEI